MSTWRPQWRYRRRPAGRRDGANAHMARTTEWRSGGSALAIEGWHRGRRAAAAPRARPRAERRVRAGRARRSKAAGTARGLAVMPGSQRAPLQGQRTGGMVIVAGDLAGRNCLLVGGAQPGQLGLRVGEPAG